MRWRKQLKDPERLIDAVITNIERQLTEARLQLFASDLAARAMQSNTDASTSAERVKTLEVLANLESTLHDLRMKRSLLISRARDADARLAIENALLDADRQPAGLALDMLTQGTIDSKSQADAIAEIRQVSAGTERKNDG